MRARGAFAALLILTAMAGLPALSASAAPALTVCDSPTSTLSGGGDQNLVVSAGAVLLLTGGTFTGKLDLGDSTGTLCVATDAVLDPKSMKNPAGDVIVLGAADLPSFTSETGFDLVVDGTVALGNLTLDGSSTLTITPTGSASTGSLLANSGSLIENAGALDTRLTTNAGSTVLNSGSFTTHSGLAIDGALRNTGHLEVVGGAFRLNAGATMSNECVIDASDDVTVNSGNASGVTNAGIIRALGGVLRVGENGVFTQTSAGIVVADTLDSAGIITGFGRYRFAKTTHTELVFAGASSAQPVTVQDLTPPASPLIFDQQSGIVVNTVAGEVVDPPPGTDVGTCADANPVADLIVTKTGPATIDPAATLTYTIGVHNAGPADASGLSVVDALPPGLSGATASGGGVIAAGAVTWTLPSLAAQADATFTVTGTAPASGTLFDRASATAATSDPNPSNNDGSTPGQSVTTEVNAASPPPNGSPSVGDAVVSTRATQTVAGTVAVEDPDVGQEVTTSLDTEPGDGTATVGPDGVFEYTPSGSFTGVDSFTVIGCDNAQTPACATGTVTVVVAPLAVKDAAETVQDTPVLIEVLTNDIGDIAGGPTVDEPPANGTVDPAGTDLLYTPGPGFVGVDVFTYRVCSNPLTVCGTAVVTVLVAAPANNPPEAQGSQVSGPADATVSGRVLAADPDVGQQVSFALESAPTAGTAVVNLDGAFSFTPPPDTSNVFSFLVSACDDHPDQACDIVAVTAVITPVAHPDAAATAADTPVTFSLTANDRGGVGAPTLVAPGPANGTVAIETDGQATYTPNPGFAGVDTFTYTVCATADPTLCATGAATVAVEPAPPVQVVVQPEQLETTATVPVVADLTFSGQATDLTFTVDVLPSEGTATVDATGRVTYTPAGLFTGRDEFTVQTCAIAEPANCGSAVVSVTVFPAAANDAAVVSANGSVDIPVEANDVGEVGPAQDLTQPANGTAEVTASILYTPNNGFIGTDAFNYTICSTVDADVCATATVQVFVQPLATDDALATVAGAAGTVDVLVNDNVGGSSPVVTIISAPTNGIAAIAAGVVSYTPSGEFTGHDSLLYEVCDASGPPLCAQAQVAIDVAPGVNPDLATTTVDTTVAIDVTANDFGDAGSPVVSRPPAHGTVTGGGLDLVRAIVGTGNVDLLASAPLVYTPDPGYFGPDGFTYARCAPSDTSLCDQTTVVVLVEPLAVPPTEPPPPSSTSLPATGADGVAGPLLAAVLMVGLGALLVGAGRRPWRQW